MDYLELFKIIKDNRVFDDMGTMFFVVDQTLQIHFINFEAVSQNQKMCIGDYLKCSNALAVPGGCGTHSNCCKCPLRELVESSMREMTRLEGDASLLLQHNRDCSVRARSVPFVSGGRKYSLVIVSDHTAHSRELMLERIFCHDLLNLSGAMSGLLDCMDSGNFVEISTVLKSISSQMMAEIKSQRDLIFAINGLLKPDNKLFRAEEVSDFVKNSLAPIASDMFQVSLTVNSTLGDVNLNTDKSLVNRVIHNMVKNACEDSCGSGISFNARYRDGKVIFSVHNDAVMPLEVSSKVFIQGNTTKEKGRGLGTFSMKLIGENYLGGKVYFRSEEGFGTEFYIELPAA